MVQFPTSAAARQEQGTARISSAGIDQFPTSAAVRVEQGTARILANIDQYPTSTNVRHEQGTGRFLTAPFLRNQSPYNPPECVSHTGLSSTVDILAFTPKTVNLATVVITVGYNGAAHSTVYDGGAGGYQAGFSGTVTQTTDGITDRQAFDWAPDGEFPVDTLVEITTTGQDSNGEEVTDTWSFTTCAVPVSLPPFVTNRDPSAGSASNPPNANVAFRVDDPDDGVVQSTIIVEINGVAAYTGGAFQAGFQGPGSSIAASPSGLGFDIVVDTEVLFDLGATITVRAYAEDVAANSVDETWQFQILTIAAIADPESSERDMYPFLIRELRKRDQEGSPREGTRFVERYFKGPNEVWGRVTNDILKLQQFFDVEEIEDRFLQYLKWIVGWTSERHLKRITDDLTDDELRRLIAVSGRLWNTRGPESATIDLLRLLNNGARSRIWNWFDFRWVLGETGLGEEHDGRDPWVIYLPLGVTKEIFVAESGTDGTKYPIFFSRSFAQFAPGTLPSTVAVGQRFRFESGDLRGQEAIISVVTTPGERIDFADDARNTINVPSPNPFTIGLPYPHGWRIDDIEFEPQEERWSNLRIVDDGNLNRDLVKRVLSLMRPSGERYEILYLSLLDLFNVDGDDLQWQPLGGSANVPVEGGRAQLVDTSTAEDTFSIVAQADWQDFVYSARIRGTSDVSSTTLGLFGLRFLRDATAAADDTMEIVVNTQAPYGAIRRRTGGGAYTVLASVDWNAIGFPFVPGVWYTLRVTVQSLAPPAVPSAGVQVQLHIDGNLIMTAFDTTPPGSGTVGFFHQADAQIEVDEVELFKLPAETDTLELNEEP